MNNASEIIYTAWNSLDGTDYKLDKVVNIPIDDLMSIIHQAEIKAKIDEVNNMPSGCEEYSIPRAMALEKEIVNE